MEDAQRFAAPAYEGNGLEQVCGIVEAYLRNVVDRSPPVRAFLQLWSEAIAGDPVLVPMFARQDANFRAYLSGRIRAGIADGSVRADAYPEAAGVFLLAVVRGTALTGFWSRLSALGAG